MAEMLSKPKTTKALAKASRPQDMYTVQQRMRPEPQMAWFVSGGSGPRPTEIDDVKPVRKKVPRKPVTAPQTTAPKLEDPPHSMVRPKDSSGPRTRYYHFLRGFRDGAAGIYSIDDEASEDYKAGYESASQALSRASDEFAARVGYVPTVLKVQDL